MFNKLLSRHLPCHPSTFLENSTTASCIPKHTPCRWERKTNETPVKRQHHTPHQLLGAVSCWPTALPSQALLTSCCRQAPGDVLSVSDFKNWISVDVKTPRLGSCSILEINNISKYSVFQKVKFSHPTRKHPKSLHSTTASWCFKGGWQTGSNLSRPKDKVSK